MYIFCECCLNSEARGKSVGSHAPLCLVMPDPIPVTILPDASAEVRETLDGWQGHLRHPHRQHHCSRVMDSGSADDGSRPERFLSIWVQPRWFGLLPLDVWEGLHRLRAWLVPIRNQPCGFGLLRHRWTLHVCPCSERIVPVGDQSCWCGVLQGSLRCGTRTSGIFIGADRTASLPWKRWS